MKARYLFLFVTVLYAVFFLPTPSRTEDGICPIVKSNPYKDPSNVSNPNVILIITDDMDLAALQQMPRVKELIANQGVTFNNAFVTNSLCCPSRASILRSQYVHSHGVKRNHYPSGGFQQYVENQNEKCDIATWVSAGSYNTALIGKYLNGYPESKGDNYVPPSWGYWVSPISYAAYQHYNYEMNIDGSIRHYGSTPEDYLTDVLRREAINYIQASIAEQKPFFLYLSPYAPHEPAPVAPRHESMLQNLTQPMVPSFNERDVTDKPKYVRARRIMTKNVISQVNTLYRKRILSLQAVDEMVEAIFARLTELGQVDNTFFIFTSDNGFHLGQHRSPHGKMTPYEDDIRVPLVIRGPGIAKGVTRDELVLETDIGPTISKWTNVEPPSFVEGRDLSPLLGNIVESSVAWRKSLLVEHYESSEEAFDKPEAEQRAVPKGPKAIPSYRALRTQDYMFVEYQTGEKELYNIRTDPHQLKNVFENASKSLVKNLSNKLRKLYKCSGVTCRSEEQTD